MSIHAPTQTGDKIAECRGPTTNTVTHLKLVRLEGGACVMTEVGEGMVGWRPSKPKCSGREPGRTMVGVGAELLGGVSCGDTTPVSQRRTFGPDSRVRYSSTSSK